MREIDLRTGSYYSNYFNNNKNNMKKLSSGIKTIVNLSDSKLGQSIHLKDDLDHLISINPFNVANTFNDFL